MIHPSLCAELPGVKYKLQEKGLRGTMKVNASPHPYTQKRHAQVTIPTTRNTKKYKMFIYTDLI
jgi:hypothetical protein